MPARLRKKRSQSSLPSQRLHPTLSLPDLTGPLLDPSWEWDELPLTTDVPKTPIAHKSEPGRPPRPLIIPGPISDDMGCPRPSPNRSPSFVKHPADPDSPVQFHRPFTPWQVVLSVLNINLEPNAHSSSRGHGMGGEDGAFRDTHQWRESVAAKSAEARQGILRLGRRRRGKEATMLNVVVAGGKGAGKTSFIQLMIDSMWYSTDEDSFGHHKGGPSSQLKGTTNGTGNTPAAPTSPGPPLLATPLLLTKDAAAHRSPPTLAANTSPRPQSTVRLSSQIIRVPPSPSDPSSPCGSEGEKSTLLLRLIDTPGFDLGADAIATASRERGLAGLTRLVEDRYEEMLREESKVVRRKARDEEGLIHLILYLIDASTVLQPRWTLPEEIDWSSDGLFGDVSTSTAHTAKQMVDSEMRGGLNPIEITMIKRLSVRANILPILTHPDGLTTSELELAKEAVRADLARAFGEAEGSGFGIFVGGVPELDFDEGDIDTDMDMASTTASSQCSAHSAVPPEPSTTNPPQMPYAVFSPDPYGHGTETTGQPSSFKRSYPWGEADVFDSTHSDFAAFREAILAVHTESLRSRTKEVLYERYRTERLLARYDGGDRAGLERLPI